MRVSDLYRTEPWGGAQGDEYLNAVIELEGRDSAEEMLRTIDKIETEFGRTREYRYAPRTCDLDILLWGGDLINKPNLVIPHPRLEERRFVLQPLCDLIPDRLHPIAGRTFRDLLAALRDNYKVKPLLSQSEISQL